MTDKEKEKFEKEVDMLRFYALAQKYGFCTPWCECNFCKKNQEVLTV